jgi:hypothetical protein
MEKPMRIRTTISLAVTAFLGLAAVAQANDRDTKDRQQNGFSFHVGPQGQYFGSRAPLRDYNAYGYAPYGYVHRYDRGGRGYRNY